MKFIAKYINNNDNQFVILQYYDYNFLLIKKEVQFIKTNNLTHSITICFWKYRNPIKLYYLNKAHYIEAKKQLIKVFQ